MVYFQRIVYSTRLDGSARLFNRKYPFAFDVLFSVHSYTIFRPPQANPMAKSFSCSLMQSTAPLTPHSWHIPSF